MNNSSVASTTVAPVAILTSEQSSRAKDALKILHSLVRDTAGEALPAFNECALQEFEAVLYRSAKVLKATQAAEEKNRVSVYQTAVAEIVTAHMVTAREAKLAYDAAPAALKTMLPAFPDTVRIPIELFVEAFQKLDPSSTIDSTRLKLHAMEVPMKKADKLWSVAIPFSAE